jgi:hypothetical protein
MKILWKKCFKKIQDGGWNEKIGLRRHLGFFQKLFSTKFASSLHQMNTKRRPTSRKFLGFNE